AHLNIQTGVAVLALEADAARVPDESVLSGAPFDDRVGLEPDGLRVPLHGRTDGPRRAPVRDAVGVRVHAAHVAHEELKVLVAGESVEYSLDRCTHVERLANPGG